MDEQPVSYEPGSADAIIALDGHYTDAIAGKLAERRERINLALKTMTERSVEISQVAARLVETLQSGHKVMIAGNGGSATEAQHFASELVGRFQRERAPYAVIALTTDTAILTAVANDYGYRQVFARQVMGIGGRGDLLLIFSTSGRSENILEAVSAANQMGITTVALTGEHPSPLEKLANVTIRVPTEQTALTQELHMLLTHLLCDIVETELSRLEGSSDR